MQVMSRVALASVAAALFFSAPSADAANIAPEGTGIIGLAPTVGTSLGTPLAHAGSASFVNDQNLTTVVDTYNEAGTETASYVGVLFATPRTDLVQGVSLNTAAFFDGGWFGNNNAGPGASGTLSPNHLVAPTLQVTTDGGTTWQNVANTNNYVSQLQGTQLPVAFGAPTAAPVATFTLNTPLTGINGIRLIGTEGGTASGGFLGVFEFGVEAVPEPAALGLIGFAGLVALRRRRA